MIWKTYIEKNAVQQSWKNVLCCYCNLGPLRVIRVLRRETLYEKKIIILIGSSRIKKMNQ